MGLLAPLYAMAALAVLAPIVFHLIRRQPRSQSEFSSLMFLQASPPRLTRRSRLDNLSLLLLRALALCLIAFAFARPFMRAAETAQARSAGREILLLVDTSGSMQRDDVWKRAIAEAKQYVAGLGSTDRIGLATFDTRLKVVVPLPGESGEQAVASDHSGVRSELDRLKPGFRPTRLAEQLMAAVELMQLRAAAHDAVEQEEREIVLFSDLHVESELEALQGFAWPEHIRLDIRRITSDKPGNARAMLMQNSAAAQSNESPSPDAKAATKADATKDGVVRVRIDNNQSSSSSEFELSWREPATGDGHAASIGGARNAVHVQVPAGQARVVSMPPAGSRAERIVLSGDDADYDNVVYVPKTAPRQERLGFVGQTRSQREDDLFFFLSQVPLGTRVRQVSIEQMKQEDLHLAVADQQIAGLVFEWPIAESNVVAIEEFARTGRPVIVVLSRAIASPTEAAPARSAQSRSVAQAETPELASVSNAQGNTALGKLLGLEQPITITEAPNRDFALLTDIDFRHPLFQPLSDAKYNDFGKIRFWSHRVLSLPESEADEPARSLGIIARFDDRAPAIIHRTIGRGDLWLLCAGWQATASQLALSTKFVPLLYGMLDPQRRSLELNAVYEVGQEIDVVKGAVVDVSHLDGTPVRSISRDGRLVLEEPGLYWLSEDGQRRQISVTLPVSESQLDPLDLDRFEQYGIVTGESDSAKQRLDSVRLSQVHELESRQKLWRWILIAAIGVLVLETLVAARLQNVMT